MFTINETKFKGRSVIASVSLKKGTIVLKETPLVCAEDAYDAIYQLYNLDTTDLTEDEEEEVKYKQQQFESLIPFTLDNSIISYDEITNDIKTLPQYMQDFFINMKPDRLRLLIAKFYRNAFKNQRQTTSVPVSAVLIKGALFNHSCCNNIDFYISSKGDFIFETNCDIMSGEELCDTYLDTTLSIKKRQKQLKSQYNFICTCNKCINHLQ